MIEEHTDPTAELHAHAANLLRTLVTAAASLAERKAQRRQADQADARARAEADQQALNARIAAERRAAELVWRAAYRDAWWERADADTVAGVVEAAGTWAASDPRAADALDHVGDQLAARYGIDLAELYRSGAPASAVADQLRDHAATHTTRQAASGGPAPDKPERPPAQQRWEEEILDAAGAELGLKVIAAEGWPRLQARLDKAASNGEAVAAQLSAAVQQRELDSAVDAAITLVWRLKNPARDRHAGRSAATAAKGTPEPGRGTATGDTPDRRAAKGRLNADLHRDQPGHDTDRAADG